MAALLKALGVAADKTEIAKEEMRQKGICMPKYITIGYGDQIGYDRTAPAIRDAAADMAGFHRSQTTICFWSHRSTSIDRDKRRK
ncbi:hypothetical protein RJJ37_10760 [Rhizobium redzepovicii]|uniref:Uncharacterized protein n=1 Tax=Rhizobium redzepovicii TaxID=2867518 RepID=A0AAW8NZJ1_9HYPH|nr:hypothetical protein [Rhizobium redzepovicii]MDR9760115.1 hypothetical protein [Rhizobium redzepovicii]MDR9781217.1 hypothetical protein [Rhizobium redzepovicii]